MRLLAAILTLVLLGAAGLAGQALLTELSAPHAQALQAAQTDPRAEPQPPAPPVTRFWPALFGEPQPPAPPEPPAQDVEEKQPPRPPKPPLDSLGYQLSGVVRTDAGTWAMVTHPTGGRLLREGDTLEAGIIVVKIDEEGLWVSRDDDAPELLIFPE